MKVLGVIPARYGSTRFPGKPLALIHGVSMIRRVYERAKQCNKLSEVVVATDDDRIQSHVIEFGGQVIMTSVNHNTGTERCAEVLQRQEALFDAVVNIQGDEPYIHPEQIGDVVDCLENGSCAIATLVKRISDIVELNNPNIPKVVLGEDGRAMYFSRRPIPYVKDELVESFVSQGAFYKHIGIYGYRSDVLPKLALLQPTVLEHMESLEQLRWLGHGLAIYTKLTEAANHAVDVPADIELIERIFPQG
ncbi:MAG: 3-deoxy-manno-octulosonate cytidylyltransferase [Bacteroidota bacterium]